MSLDWLLQALSHYTVDIRAGLGSLPVRSLHLQNCTADDRSHGTSNCGKWVYVRLSTVGSETRTQAKSFMSGAIRTCRSSRCCSCFRFLHPWNADWIPVFSRVGRGSRSATEKTQLKKKKKNCARFSYGSLNSSPLWAPESQLSQWRWRDGHNGRNISGSISPAYSPPPNQNKEILCVKLTSGSRKLCNIKEINTLRTMCKWSH